MPCHFCSLLRRRLSLYQGIVSDSSLGNVSGNPWPLEIVRPIRGSVADLKYRLSISPFLVYSDSIPTLKWDFSGEDNDTIMGYECRKATTEFAGRQYTAWFAPEIPLPFGPYKFGGLPGLILKIEDGERQFVWEAIGWKTQARMTP